MKQTISFVGTVAAGSEKVLSSRILGFPYTIERLKASFALNQNRQVQIRFFLSMDKEQPSSGFPTGSNLLLFSSTQPYCVGDDDSKDFCISVKSEDWPTWLKVHATNSDGFDHDIDCQITIDTLNSQE